MCSLYNAKKLFCTIAHILGEIQFLPNIVFDLHERRQEGLQRSDVLAPIKMIYSYLK